MPLSFVTGRLNLGLETAMNCSVVPRLHSGKSHSPDAVMKLTLTKHLVLFCRNCRGEENLHRSDFFPSCRGGSFIGLQLRENKYSPGVNVFG